MKTIRPITAQAAGAALALFALSCGQQRPPDTRAADEAAIRDADIAWTKAAGAKQLDATLSYYADDGSVLPPNAPMATGKEAIRKVWVELLQAPGFSLNWQPVKVEVARSGDVGYSQGTYEMSMNDPKGQPMKDRGKYLVVWKKQADGNWKAVADMFSSDLPPAPSPPAKK
jgi:uncharacterized protein (TIGR02246 family)